MDGVHGGCGLRLEGGLSPSHLPRPPTCFYSTPTLDFEVFIGPESDHWLCLSLTNSLTAV